MELKRKEIVRLYKFQKITIIEQLTRSSTLDRNLKMNTYALYFASSLHMRRPKGGLYCGIIFYSSDIFR